MTRPIYGTKTHEAWARIAHEAQVRAAEAVILDPDSDEDLVTIASGFLSRPYRSLSDCPPISPAKMLAIMTVLNMTTAEACAIPSGPQPWEATELE